jgi:hypothetical protein
MTHAQMALRLIVVEGHGKIVQKPEYRLLPLREPIQQIASRILFGSAGFALALHGLLRYKGKRIGLIPLGEEFLIATQPLCQERDIEMLFACSFGLFLLVAQQRCLSIHGASASRVPPPTGSTSLPGSAGDHRRVRCG